ncbi:MAG TPA: serine/threonine-protein kinase [Gemmatimonadaceae bacterium]|nr:serine/threonine-protein kinase [Gemmatimonadaceae bacterium]
MSSLSDTAVDRLRAIMELPAAREQDRYEIGALIGEGGMGSVYVAHDRELGRDVALKVLRDAAPTVAESERILREARILASLEHPGIVPIHDVGTLSDGRLFYVMKRIRGERFDDFVRAPHSRTELLRSFLQLCDAVAFAHAAGVIHRDLKPQNVMLGAFGEVLVLDWGVAKAARPPSPVVESAVGTAAGTPGYMAPEQLQGDADERADVYGLGGLLFFLLTRQHPSAGKETDQQWPSGSSVPSALRAICERARAEAPVARYQSVASMAADVANYLDALPVAAHTEGLVERARRIALRHRTAILLVLAYLAMRVALLLFTRR